MYRKKSRQCCAAMLIVSVCLRLCMFLGLDEALCRMAAAALQDPNTARVLLYLETGAVAELPQEEPEVITVHKVSTTVVHSKEPKTVSAKEITVTGGCTYAYDKEALLTRPTTLDFSGSGPKVLIVHSHTTEAYEPSDGMTYRAITDHRTLDETRNVVAVGAVLAETLTQLGVETVHDPSVNDYPDYNTSYYNTLQKIEGWKEKYPGIQLILDIHRDAVEDEQGQAVALLSQQAGETAARLMLVVGTDEGGLTHPNWQENLANALKLQSVLMGSYPGLCRQVDLRTERFNQHTAPGALLIEVGTNGNTLTQAKASARLLAHAIADNIQMMQKG